MSSADIQNVMNTVRQDKADYEALKTSLSGTALPEKLSLTRDTQGMAGTKYKQHHENVKSSFTTFRGEASKEKEDALEALDNKIKQLGDELTRLEGDYQTALANERAEAERKAAEARRKAEEAKNKNK